MTRKRPDERRAPADCAGDRESETDSDGHGAVPDAAFRRLHEVVGGDAAPAERRRALLAVLRETLGGDTAFLATVDPETGRWRVRDGVGPRRVVRAGATAPVEETYCRHLVETDADGTDAPSGATFGLADAREAVADPAYWRLGLGSYLGASVAVGGRAVGTVAVAGAGPREPYCEAEHELVRAAADLLSAHPDVAGVADGTGVRPRPVGVPASWFEGGMLTVGPDRRVERADEGAVAVLGRPRSALEGRPLAVALGGADDRRAELAVREAVASDRPVTFELRDGDRWLWAGVYPAGDDVHVYLRAATDRRDHERVLERVTDGFLSLDAERRFTYANRRAGDLLGHDPDALAGRRLEAVVETDLRPAEEDPTVAHALRRAVGRAEAGEAPASFEARGPAGRWVHGRVFLEDGGVSAYLHDVTDQRRRERVLDGLLGRTRELLRAESRGAVAATVADAVEETIGFERGRVLLTREDGLLVPAPALERPDATLGPVHEPGVGPVGKAFADGEVRVVEDLDVEGTTTPLLVVPLGDHGVVLAEETDAVDDGDVSLVSLLAESAVAALDRAERSERLSTYERLLEASGDRLYAVDDGGRLTFVSPALAERLDYDPAALVGQHHTTIVAASGVREFGETVRGLARSEAETERTVETELVTAEDARLPVEIEVSVIPGEDGSVGAVGVVRDIADRLQVREELSRERTRFSQLFENLPDPALELEVRDGPEATSTVRAVNPAFETALTVEADRVVGEPLSAAFDTGAVESPAEDGDGIVERIEHHVREREPVSFQLRRPTDDRVRDFVFQAIPYRETEDCVYAFGIYTDITEQRDRERRLEVLNRVLRHNMRNQLNVVSGYADYLARRLGTDDDGDEAETAVLRAAEEVRDSARRVLDLAKEARRSLQAIGGQEEGPVDVGAVAASVVDQYESDHPEATIDLDLPDIRSDRATGDEADPEALESEPTDGDRAGATADHESATATDAEESVPAVSADAGQDVELALAHLVENAIVHNDGDPTVRVGVRRTGDSVEIRVADDGPGIPRHERAVVAGEIRPTQLEHGSGLGLWVVRWVVESYGGTVEFDPGADHAEGGTPAADGGTDGTLDGTTVVLRLPSV